MESQVHQYGALGCFSKPAVPSLDLDEDTVGARDPVSWVMALLPCFSTCPSSSSFPALSLRPLSGHTLGIMQIRLGNELCSWEWFCGVEGRQRNGQAKHLSLRASVHSVPFACIALSWRPRSFLPCLCFRPLLRCPLIREVFLTILYNTAPSPPLLPVTLGT